ncbi:MAG: AAA family ATPase [Bauldia sp.]|nr:AAA family ATPase [Bauldia sp.]
MTDTTSTPSPGRGRTSEGAAVQGERRIITALFCDVVNSTALAEQLDPEDWTEILNEAFQHLTAPILRYEGTVAKLMGDAVLAFFGAPVAHEDDPRRAVLAALDMIAAIGAFRETVKSERGLEFDVRIGINTGPVVVADIGARAMDALGDAINVAARMEQAAGPGTILLSGDTYRLLAPLFDVEALGEIELKGKADRVPAFRVIGPKAAPGRVRGIDGVSAPLIGRDREFARLRDAMTSVLSGRGQIVGLLGEAGLGKSRMLSELKQEWDRASPPNRWIVLSGVPYDASRPYGLFQNYARSMFGVELNDPVETIHDKIVATLRGHGKDEETIALCATAFERVIAARTLLDGSRYDVEVVKNDIYNTLSPGLARHARNGPLVLVVDDLHWADPASVELLLALLSLVEDVPLLIVFALRPERQSAAWRIRQRAETDYPHRYTELSLRPLDATDTNALVSALLSIADLPAELRQLILRKTDGNPYFVEEIVRTLIDEGVVRQTADGLHWEAKTDVSEIAIPDTLQALLMTRIDRLDQETRSTLQLASVIGRSFYYSILKRISESAMALDRQLLSLERVELLLESARLPELEYMFKHELARDAAYGSLLNRKRRDFHRRVGEAIETIFVGRLEEQAHRLARHFDLAGDTAKAQRYYEVAAETAASMHATAESAAHLAHALDCARKNGAPPTDLERLAARQAALLGAATQTLPGSA